MRRFFNVIFVIAIILGIIGCSKPNNPNNNQVSKSKPKYSVDVHIDFIENWIFSKYNVYLSFGNESEELIHGKDADINFVIEEGTHTLTFENIEDLSVISTVSLTVDCNMKVGYKIQCHSTEIEVTELYIDKDKKLNDDEIKIDFDKTKFNNKNYIDAIKILKNIGFTNIVEKPIYDIVWGITEEGEVEKVKIDGSVDYKRGDIFKKDVKIIISYHLKESSDPNKSSPPYNNDTASKKNYKEVVKSFKDKGFTNIKTEKIESTNSEEHKNGDVSFITISGETANLSSVYSLDEEVVIGYYVIIKEETPEPELSLYYAKKAFEKYGERIYPYGFKCHWILDFINYEQQDDGSWFLKVGVTITNLYGTKYKTIAEGIVSGTDTYQTVTQFYVS